MNNYNIDKLYETKNITKKVVIDNSNLSKEDLYEGLKKNVKMLYENKCVKNEYIDYIYNIDKYDKDGIINYDMFGNNIKYSVKMKVRICNIKKNRNIVVKLNDIKMNDIELVNGPILCYTNKELIKKDGKIILNNNDLIVKNTGHKIEIGDYLIVNIKAIRYYDNSANIASVCNIIDYIGKEEGEKYIYKKEKIEMNNKLENDIYNMKEKSNMEEQLDIL